MGDHMNKRRGGVGIDGLSNAQLPFIPVQPHTSILAHVSVHNLAKTGSLKGLKDSWFMDPFCIHERKTRTEETPLHIAVEFGHMDVVEWLITSGADVTAVTVQGISALHKAASNGDVTMAKYLIDTVIRKAQEDADLDDDVSIESLESLGKSRRRALTKKTEDEKPVMEEPDNHVVSCSMINECYDRDWMTPLHYACVSGHVDMIKFLIQENGALPAMKTKSVGDDALMVASYYGNLEAVEYLLTMPGRVALNVNVLTRNKHGNTCLHRACERQHPAVARVLQKKGANLLVKNDADVTCIDMADAETIKGLTPIIEKRKPPHKTE
jgi:ankyrin repeat protein